MVLKSEFDNMEESLRDALRHPTRHVTRVESSRRVTSHENLASNGHSYVNIAEQNGSHRGFNPSGAHQQPQELQQSGLILDDFRKYCVLLAERVKKMEDQNHQLIKLAEKQKVEYNKVAAQVVQSELVQRRLQSECTNLRRQVHQLANYNKVLQQRKGNDDTRVDQDHTTNPPEEDHTGQIFPEDGIDPMTELHSSVERTTQNGMADKLVAQIMTRLALDTPNKEFIQRNKTADVAAVVELYAALQKSAISDLDPPKEEELPKSDKISSTSLGVIPEQPESWAKRRSQQDNADYATPSSICASESCSCSLRHQINSKPPSGQPKSGDSPGKGSCKKSSQRIFKLKKSSSGQSLEKSQSFDNNAYIEVELRQYKGEQPEESYDNDGLNPAFQGDGKQEPTNDTTSKRATTERPSSLILDLELDANRSQPVSSDSGLLSPVSPYENEPFDPHNLNNSNNRNFEKQIESPKQNEIEKPTVWLQRKSTPHSSISSRSSFRSNKPSPSLTRRSHSKTPSITDLPPPPPPPPCDDVIDHVTRTEEFPRSTSKDDSVFSDDAISSPTTQTEVSRPLRKLSVWKETRDPTSTNQTSEESPTRDAAGWRRKSYSAACRKSQSLDHLYELGQLENQEKQRIQENVESNPTVFSTLQMNKRSHLQSAFTPLSSNPLRPRNPSKEDFPPPPPPHVLREVMQGPAPIEEDGYVLMDPIGAIEQASEAKQVKETPPRPAVQSKLMKKNSRSEPSLHHRRHNIRGSSKDLPKVPDFEPDVGAKEDSFDPSNGRLKNRRMSEGSASRRRSERQSFDDECGAGKLRRHRSVSSEHSIRRRHNPENQKSPKSPSGIPTGGAGKPQPRFPATNPYVKLASPPRPGSQKRNDPTTDSYFQYPNPKNEKTEIQNSPPRNSNVTVKSVEKTKEQLDSTKSAESNPNRGRAPSKLTQPSKKLNSGTSGKKKSASPSSISFVNLMKAKFGRSSSGNRPGNKKMAEEHVTAEGPLESSLPVKAATSLIDPRTLSLEPNSYLPPGGDGLAEKKSKIKLGNRSDAAVGRKLSRPFPAGQDSNSRGHLTKVAEEVVSDEGFAEGSTIERAEKEAACDAACDAATRDAKRDTEPRYVDVVMRKSEENVVGKTECSRNESKESVKRNLPKKDNSDWYDNVVSMGGNNSRRFQIIPTETTFEGGEITTTNAVKQKHTRKAIEDEPPYENYPLVTGSLGQLAPPSYENVLLARAKKLENPRPSSVSYPSPKSSSQGREIFATGVTIVRTSPNNNTTQSPASYKPKVGLRPPKPNTSGPIGRIMKSVGNHYTGSKEDLTGKQEFGYQQNGQSNISPGKPERESNRNKLNYAEHQKVFEKAFISSVVQAELSQMAGARNSIVEGRMSRTTPDNSPCRLPLPPSSGGNSTGTGSSFGSLPSDGIADVIEARGMTSSGSSDPTTKPAVRLSKGKRNSATSFRYSALQGTVDSNTSTSSSESSFRGRNMKNSGPRCADTTTSSVDSRPREMVEHSGNIKSPVQRGSEGTPQSKIAPNRRSQSGSRISRFTAASKLPAPGKSPESRSTTPKSVFNSPSDLPPTPQASQTQRLKLAPLNYGINPPSSPNNPQINEPVYENAATFRQQRPAEKQTQHSNRIPGSSLRPPGSSIAIPSVSRPSAGCGPTQLDNRRTRKGIPSATGLHRPRPVYPGVGAG